MVAEARAEQSSTETIPVAFRALPPMRGHDCAATAIAYSPRGTLILSGGSDGSLRVYDPLKLLQVQHLVGHNQAVTALAIEGEERFFLSGSKDRSLRIWDLAARAVLHQLRCFGDEITDVAFSPDGERVAATSLDHTVGIFETLSGKEVQRIHLDVPLTAVAFHPAGKKLFVGAANSVIHCFSTEGWKAEGKPFKGSHGNWVTSMSCSADGRALASGCLDTSVCIWDQLKGKEKSSSKGGRSWVQAVQLSPEGNHLFSGGRDGSVVVTNVETGKQEAVLRSHGEPINDIAIFVRGTRLAAACEDGSVHLWALSGMEWSAWSPAGAAAVVEEAADEGPRGPNPAFLTDGAFDYQKWKAANPQLFG